MNANIFFVIVTFLVALMVAQAVLAKENVQSDVLYMYNPDTFPEVVSDPGAAESDQRRGNCVRARCQRLCSLLGFRLGLCNNQGRCGCF